MSLSTPLPATGSSQNPGHTEIYTFEAPSHTPLCTKRGVVGAGAGGERPLLLLGSGLVTLDLIFNNGLYQNILILYDFFESLGYKCILLAHKPVPPASELGWLCRYTAVDIGKFLVAPPEQIFGYIEIAMSLDVASREFFLKRGAFVTKLYLGNALNIDVETTTIMKGFYIPHHNAGALDAVWTSPHYLQHLQYLQAINKTERSEIVPYLWDSCFLEQNGVNRWSPSPGGWRTTDIVILEPNISFQKHALYPLLLVEAFARRCSEWRGRVVLMNYDKLERSAHFVHEVLPALTSIKGRLVPKGRDTLPNILQANPHALFVTHNVNNDYNYMLFELMDRGFPALHTSAGWKNFGYYWSSANWEDAQSLLFDVLQNHTEREAAYTCAAKQLAWQHSPWNPINQALWLEILERTKEASSLSRRGEGDE